MSSEDPFLVSVMSRRQLYPVNGSTEEGIYIYSPEDIILQKLNWYKLWDSRQKQWMDVLEVLKVQKDQLDLAYLYRWALKLELADLLIKAMFQSGY
ncbi:hypothetical protein NG798_27380 [Ancylothrix sp. C2]|uniref:hypothetical protein n=1 Tax=Ancylothrix sp. D3o TaxID=2953691 RepID=UPI0021BAB034|nr:hypothetical protein [Ancylothrix sp. D3o]MCT7953523.1 hypothetical protein [Ancylothrix sp. D3o]